MKNILSFCVLLSLARVGFAENIGSTNREETHLQLRNRHRRSQIPLCPCNMIGDFKSIKNNAWRCRCKKGYLYLRSKNDCFLPYRRGPCPLGHYIYYAVNTTRPQCVVNPCSEDDLVLYNGTCHKIGKWGEGPCGDRALVTDRVTLQPRCLMKEGNEYYQMRDQLSCSGDRFLVPLHWKSTTSPKCECPELYTVYFASEKRCYKPYRQGPCPPGQYVYLAINETIPQCVVNPCSKDGLVPYNGSCHTFEVWEEGPCNVGALVTDPDTFQLKCIEEITDPGTVAHQLKCSDDRLLDTYGSKNVSIWTCKCWQYWHYYFPSENGCYQLYRQGPCSSGQYVHMTINETVPQCVVNPCHEDGLVPYHGNCYKFAMWGEACEHGGLIADPETLELKCIRDVTNTNLPSLTYLIKCPANMVLLILKWPNEPRSWHCKCSGYNELYFPSLQSCYKPYTRGPCLSGYYVYRAINETVAQCVVNPCYEDGLVLYNGTCHKLGVSGGPACGTDGYLESKIWPNLQIECVEPVRSSATNLVTIVAPDSECEPDIPNDPNSACMKTSEKYLEISSRRL